MQIKKVLMVDDDAPIRRVTEISLTRVGKWNVHITDSGAKALELIPEYKPDVILLDVMMPGMDGPTLFKLIRQRGITTPVIFLTAKVQKEEIEDYLQLGAVGVISKPFDPLTLPQQIQQILDGVEAVTCFA